MVKTFVKSWVYWGVQGYVISPVIDAIIQESDNEILQGIKGINNLYGAVNQMCFQAPIWAVKEGMNFVKEKTKKAEG